MFIRPRHQLGRGPVQLEVLLLKWLFIRKVYWTLAVQMLLTLVVASIVMFVQPVNLFFSTPGGWVLYIFSLILPIIGLWHLYHYSHSYPVNQYSLGVFIVALSFAVGMTCAFNKGGIILESVILTSFAVESLIAYTYVAQKHGCENNCLGPFWQQFIVAAVIILVVFSLIQIFFPVGRIWLMICGGLASLTFCGYIINQTKWLIVMFAYEEYVWASVAPYVNIINSFLSFLARFRASD
ncbi:protein LIFEGUARD 4-like [Carex rostrata]